MKQTALEWLKVTVKAMIENGGDADLHAVLWHIEQSKEMEKEQTQNLNSRWAESREQTREIATRIGFNKGFESGLLHHDTYYEELNATQLDEDDFHKQYVSLTFNENFTSNEK